MARPQVGERPGGLPIRPAFTSALSGGEISGAAEAQGHSIIVCARPDAPGARGGRRFPLPLRMTPRAPIATPVVDFVDSLPRTGPGAIARVSTNLALLWGPFLVSATSPRRAAFFHLRVQP